MMTQFKTAFLAACMALPIQGARTAFAQQEDSAESDSDKPEPEEKASDTKDSDDTETPASEESGPSAEELNKAKTAFQKGNELFEKKDFENAVKEFKTSYRLSKRPVLLYNIAFTLDEMGDQKMALFYYEKFLRDTEDGTPNRELATKRIAELKESGGTQDSSDSAAEIVTNFKHIPVEEAPPGQPLDVTAVVPEGAPWKVFLHYRPSGESKFTTVPMTPRYTELVGRIPAPRTRSKSIQYYLEVQGPDGKVLERSGEPTSPHVIYMDENAKARFYPDLMSSTGAMPDDPTEPGNGVSTGPGGWTDVTSSKFQALKWGSTIGAGALLLASASFYLISTDAATSLESESVDSRLGMCPEGPPCVAFSGSQKDLQSKGELYETLGTVSLVVSGVAALGAGALWYFDLTGDKSSSRQDASTISAVPMLGDDFIGGAATLRF